MQLPKLDALGVVVIHLQLLHISKINPSEFEETKAAP
jgi:hypothetical protein